jgi:hypothetical protein
MSKNFVSGVREDGGKKNAFRKGEPKAMAKT